MATTAVSTQLKVNSYPWVSPLSWDNHQQFPFSGIHKGRANGGGTQQVLTKIVYRGCKKYSVKLSFIEQDKGYPEGSNGDQKQACM